jgi:HK97 family phage portal protein
MGLGRLLSRASTGTRITLTPVIDDVPGASTSTFIATNNLNVLAGAGSITSWQAGMSIPAAWRATTLIADLVAGLPFAAYRKMADRPIEKLPTPPVLEQPHPPEIRFCTMANWVIDLLWNGNGIGIVADRSAASVPTALSPRPAEDVQVGRDSDTGRVTYKIGSTYYDYTDVFHVKGPCKPGELRGKGILELHLETLTLARDQRRQAGAITSHGVPSGIIESSDPEMDEAKAAVLKSSWLDAQTMRVPMVTTPQTKFTPISWNPEQLQLVEARKMSKEDIALIFGLPGYYLNVEQTSRVYTNVTAENLQLLRFSSVAGHLTRFEQSLSGLLPRGTEVRADLDSTLLRPDIVTRFGAYRMANPDAVWLEEDEIREMEGRQPRPEAAVEPPQALPGPRTARFGAA